MYMYLQISLNNIPKLACVDTFSSLSHTLQIKDLNHDPVLRVSVHRPFSCINTSPASFLFDLRLKLDLGSFYLILGVRKGKRKFKG